MVVVDAAKYMALERRRDTVAARARFRGARGERAPL